MRLLSETMFEELPNDLLLRYIDTPLREFENEFIDGPLLDIGCGHTTILLDYANTNRRLYALDNDKFQLDLLKKRIDKLDNKNIDNWEFLNLNFTKDNIPENNYAAIILTNILHFFTIADCIKLGETINHLAVSNTLIFVSVHSSKYYANKPATSGNNDYFKHYFEMGDLDLIFPPDKFNKVFVAHVEKAITKLEIQIINKWLDKLFKKQKITDSKIINDEKSKYLQDKRESDIKLIIKKI